ncbi:UDP-N-acetylglucosamine--N-acetylmuramyl-(pentapeptide) pyrophosphoryl-undecaprenol N-acetylglucosamine transferase, partial [Moraxella canis]
NTKHVIELKPFIEDMAAAYAWADVIVCRAGALTVTEIQNAGVAAIFVPLPHAVDDHQTANARVLVDAGAAILMPQSALTGQLLAITLDELDRKHCQYMASIARSQAKDRVDVIVADVIEQSVN